MLPPHRGTSVLRAHRRHLSLAGSAAAAITAVVVLATTTNAATPDNSSVFGPDAKPLAAVPASVPDQGLVYGGLVAAKTGPCVGGYQIAGVTPAMRTHGPDPAPAGVDLRRPVKALPRNAVDAAAAGLAVCEGDGSTGKRVEVLYIHGSTSRYTQVLEQLRTTAEGVDVIFNESARETGGERHVRFVTENVNGACRPVVRDVQIADSALNANDWAPLLNAVKAAGYTRTDRKYLEFVDANVYCGIGGFAGDTTKGANNRSNRGPEYARADNRCWSAGVAAHELGHTLGAVNNNAPNGSGFAHCVDEWDVMCYKDDASTTLVFRCANQSHDQRLDCNHDDYYHTNPAAGSYLATFWNVADSEFLIRGPGTPTSAPPTTTRPPTSAPPTSSATTFRLVNGAASGSCLTDPNSTTTNNTQFVISTCNGIAGQTFTQVGSTLRVVGKCLDAFGAGTANGTRIILWDCNGGTNQQWTFRSDGAISGVASGRCLTPTGGATANNTLIILSDCNGQAYQRWNRS